MSTKVKEELLAVLTLQLVFGWIAYAVTESPQVALLAAASVAGVILIICSIAGVKNSVSAVITAHAAFIGTVVAIAAFFFLSKTDSDDLIVIGAMLAVAILFWVWPLKSRRSSHLIH